VRPRTVAAEDYGSADGIEQMRFRSVAARVRTDGDAIRDRRKLGTVAAVPKQHPMAPADAAWLHMDRPTNLMVVNGVFWFDEPVDWDRLRARFLEGVVERFDRFRQVAVEGPLLAGPRWRDDPGFDADLHFHHVALPPPQDRRALQEFVSDRLAAPLDRDRPLWEVYYIDEFGHGAAVLIRIHHSIADGIALARVMLLHTDEGETDSPGIDDAAPPNQGSGLLGVVAPLLRAGGIVARESARTARRPLRVADMAAVAIDEAQTLGKLLLPWSDPPSPIKGPLHRAHRVSWSEPVELWRVKRAGAAFGATVNDVLVAAVAGAIGNHLRERGEDVGEVHALVPFNLRPLDQPLPRELGNRFGLVLLGVPVGIADPVARLAVVKRGMDEIKHGHEGPITLAILGLMGRTPYVLEQRLIDYFSAKGSMVLTNVAGPRQRLTVVGTPLRGVLVWAPCSGSVGMSISVFSYDRKVTVGFLVDAGLVPDPQTLADDFRAEVLALARAARATGSHGS
jgi:diacylglycerol O-acyltransferase / wax synthase